MWTSTKEYINKAIMHIFGAAGVRPGVLRSEHIHKLTVDSRGSKEVRETMKRFGGRDSKSVVTIFLDIPHEWEGRGL